MADKPFSEIITDCPICKRQNAFIIRETEYDIPGYGPSILFSGKCSVCGYKFSMIIPNEQKTARRIEFKVEDKDDLNVLVFIGENTDILLPELNVEILSTEINFGYITTVEGILDRVKEKADFYCDSEEDKIRCIKFYDDLNLALEGKKAFTLVLKDKYGRSNVLSPKIKISYT